MEHKHFDQIIADKLAQLQGTGAEDHWSMLESKLENFDPNTPTSDPVREDSFDQLIKTKISATQFSPEPHNWSILEAQLDELEAPIPANAPLPAESFDHIIHQKVSHYNVLFNNRHWALFEERFNALLILQSRYLRLKAIEITLMSVLLLLFLNWPGSSDQRENQPIKAGAPINGIPIAQTNSNHPIIAKEENNHQEMATSEASNTIANGPKREGKGITQDSYRTKNSNKESSVKDNEVSDRSEYLPNKDAEQNANTQLPIAFNPEIRKPLSIESLPIENAGVVLDKEDHEAEVDLPDYTTSSDMGLVEVVLPSDIPRISAISFQVERTYKRYIRSQIPILPNRFVFRATILGSSDVNRIITPPNFSERRFDENKRFSLGHSGGVLLSAAKGRWEFETGLLYAQKKNTPTPILFVKGGNLKDGYRAAGLKTYVLDIVQIPLHAKYHYLSKGKWLGYVTGGMALNTALYTDYLAADQDGFRTNDFAPAPAPNRSRFDPSLSTIINDEKSTPPGFFENGSFERNSFLTIDVGFGIERYLNHRISIFVQPTYHHALPYFSPILSAEIGPDDDRISTSSLFIGGRFRFGRQ